MSLFASILRDLVEPLALSILEWAWSYDLAAAPPLFTIPLRFYAYSATSVLLWMYELLPHWLILTLILCGVLFGIQLALSLLCFPLSTLCGIFVWLFKTSVLLFRGLLVCLKKLFGCCRGCFRPCGLGCHRRRAIDRAERARLAVIRQLENQQIPALVPDVPANVRILPAPPIVDDIPAPRTPRPAPRNNRRRSNRSPRR